MQPENVNLERQADLDNDTSRPNLADVWKALDSQIYRVVDEEGVNVADGQLRLLASGKYWLYVDETDGYQILDSESAGRLICVKDEEHEARGWDRNGNVIAL